MDRSTDSSLSLQVPDLHLREWTQQINLLSKIPDKAQKGFQTLDLHLTCIGVISDYIALGTNVGIIYWYNRNQDSLERLKVEGTNTCPIVSVSVVSCENYMIAAGNLDGLIAVFQVPKRYPDESTLEQEQAFEFREFNKSRKAQIYTVRGIHKSTITALCWSSNGMKLFSGDALGMVAETEIDFCTGVCKSFKLVDENQQIVQLSYSNQNLLISTTQRTILYSSKTRLLTKVGNQDRKSTGSFGGVFAPGLWNKNLKLYATRPGLRLWLADQEGAVQNTLIYKDSVKTPHSKICLIDPAPPEVEVRNSSADRQFSVLYNFMGKYLVTSYNNVLYVLDPVTVKVISSCTQLRSILSMDVHKDEIFIIETCRNVVRISARAEEVVIPENRGSGNTRGSLLDSVPGLKPEFRIPGQPFKLIASKIKETSLALPKFDSSALITTMRNVLEADLNIQDGYIPNVIPMRPPAVVPDFGTGMEQQHPHPFSPEIQQYNSEKIEKFDKISNNSFQDVLLSQFKPERKKMRKRNGDAVSSDSVSLSSQGSSTSTSEILSGTPEKEQTVINSSSPWSEHDNHTQTGIQVVPKISDVELRTKEEMLAKMLKWSELLPSFETVRKTVVSGIEVNQSADTGIHRSNGPSPASGDEDCIGEIDSGTLTLNARCETNTDGTCIIPISGLTQEPVVDYSTILAATKLDNDIFEVLSSQVERAFSGDYEHFPSIYDGNNSNCSSGSCTISNVTSLEFGPPSGSSNVTLREGSLRNAGGQILLRQNTDSHIPHSLPSILPIQDMRVSGVILNDYWIQYELPSAVTNISSSDKYLICIDKQHSVYYSSLAQEHNELCWIKACFQASQVISSPDGSTLWRISPAGELSALENCGDPFSESSQWETVCNRAKYAVIGNEIAFIIKTDHTLCVLRLDKGTVSPAFEVIQTPIPFASIHVLDDAIWALGNDGRVFYRSCVGYSPDSWYGDAWNELRLNIPPVVSMSIGPQGSIWMVDLQNQICFINDFIASRGKYQLWNVSISEELNTLAAQSQYSSSHSHWAQMLTRWASSSQGPDVAIPIISSCHSIVACVVNGGTSVFLNKTCTSGHKWDPVTSANGSLKSWKFKNVYAGSFYNTHGNVWLEESRGKIFCLQGGKGALLPIDTPCTKIATIATAPEAIWVLDQHGTIHARCNINADNELGNGWDRIELSPIPEDRKLVHISCGSERVWSCDDHGDIYIRTGSLNPPSSTDFSPAWIKVEGAPSYGLDAIFTKVYVGSSDRIVFALDSRGGVYAREAVFSDLPIGTSWVLIPSVEAVSLSISESAVWALSTKGEIFRRSGISSTNFVGDSWKRIPGSAKVLTVSVCDEVWILDNNGTLCKHFVEELYLRASDSTMNRARVIEDDDEDTADWELLG